MKNNIVFVILITLTMITSFIVGAVGNITINTLFDENDADLPEWDLGDSWTYEITIDGGLENFGMRNLKLENLIFTVIEVQEEYYKLDVSSELSGKVDLTANIFITFVDTEFDGVAYVNKSTLMLEKINDLDIDGNIKINNLPGSVSFQAEGHINLSYGGPNLPLMFPINIADDPWIVDFSTMEIEIYHGVSIPGLDIPNPIEFTFYIQEHIASCEGWDIVNVGNTDYDSLKIVSATDLGENGVWNHEYWYSPAAGNIVKVVSRNMPLSWGGWGYYDFDMELISTTYQASSNPPETPITPDGPTTLDVGDSGEYTTVTTDPDGNNIKYVFNWGDGTTTLTEFKASGTQITISHTFMQKGNFDVKVKARDKYGKESSWSDAITVTIINTAPAKPSIPDGPASGKIKTSHTYTTSSTDPEGHKIKYKFDWGDGQTSWTELVNSGETASASHKWTSTGNYEIKVKAVDEYGEESEWSDPLPISMPRSRNLIQIKFIDLLDRILEKFPILEQILGFF